MQRGNEHDLANGLGESHLSSDAGITPWHAWKFDEPICQLNAGFVVVVAFLVAVAVVPMVMVGVACAVVFVVADAVVAVAVAVVVVAVVVFVVFVGLSFVVFIVAAVWVDVVGVAVVPIAVFVLYPCCLIACFCCRRDSCRPNTQSSWGVPLAIVQTQKMQILV